MEGSGHAHKVTSSFNGNLRVLELMSFVRLYSSLANDARYSIEFRLHMISVAPQAII